MASWRRFFTAPRVRVLAGVIVGVAVAAQAADGPRSGLNVLLITIDTLRADRLGAYGFGPARTPVMDGLARRGLLVHGALTSTPVTLPSHATLVTGRLPPQHGVRGNSFYTLPASEVTWAELLRARGYRTAAFVGAAVLDHRFGLDQGFTMYDDHTTSAPGAVLIAERAAATVVSRASRWVESLDGAAPFFLWVHLFDPHDPYLPPEPFRSAFPGSPYDGEIAYVDHEIGRLLEALRSRRRLDHTLIVLTADHGESLGEHGEMTHGIFLYDATLRVPLILAGPGIPRGTRAPEDPAGLVDVMPTVLARLGIAPPRGVAGRDLMAPTAPHREFLYAETFLPRDFYNWSELKALRSSRLKLVAAPIPELFDLRADPGERLNLADSRREEVHRLMRALAGIEQALGDHESTSRVSEELASKLQSLGYVAAAGTAPPPAAALDRPDPKTMIGVVTMLDAALALVHGGAREEAVPALRQILTRDAGNHLAARTLADVLFDLGRDAEAVEAYRLALATGRNASYFHYRLALLHERAGDYGRAAHEFSLVLQRSPDAAREILERSDRLREAGRTAGALAYLEALQAAGVGGAALDLRLAEARLQAGRPEAAVEGLTDASKRDPASAEIRTALAHALTALGRARGDRGDLAGAVDALTRALALAPSDFNALADLGITEMRRGRANAALAAFTRALAVRPNEARLLNLAAELHYRRRDYQVAHDLLLRSLAVEPGQPNVTRALGEVEARLAAREQGPRDRR